jgi:hypothetical protein
MLPAIWKDGLAFILGGGPSLSNVNLETIKNERIIAVNNAYGYPVPGKGIKSGSGWLENTEKYIPYDWVDAVWFGDRSWFDRHHIFLKSFKGIIATCTPSLADKKINGLINYKRSTTKQLGIDSTPGCVAWNKNSGGCAINFAYHLGVKVIVLLGFDMKRTADKTNWHNDHPSPPNKNPYYRFLRCFPIIKRDADALGIRIINCTEGSAITDFEFMKLEELLEWKKVNMPQLKTMKNF